MKWIYVIMPVLLIVGCASTVTTPEKTFTTTMEKPNSTEEAKLPKLYMPEERNLNNARRVSEIFSQVQSLRTVSSFGFQTLRDISSKPGFSGAVLSRCDFDIIKALVAYGWAPSVIILTPGGSRHVRSIIGYNDPPEELTLTDPMETGTARQIAEKQMKLSYSDFLRMWSDQQKTCLLVFPQYVDENTIKNAIWQFLPKEKTDSVEIRTKVRSK